MEEILEKVKTYDIPELRRKLIENGVSVGPIYPQSKSLFQRRLAKELFQLQGGKLEEDEEKKPDPKETTVEKPVTAATVSQSKLPDVFYAICLPESVDPDIKKEVNQLVFSDKELALKTAKKIKNSRFKVFKSEKDAEDFSTLTADSAFSSPRNAQNTREDVKEKEKSVSTESSPYKSPRTQEVNVIRRGIEGGNVEFFKKCIWDNPRYLVGSGDTPVIYQEGFRYTAMHVAALKNKPEMCQLILDTVENPDFIKQLYSQSFNTVATQNSRINFLVDLYLNMPDKGNCESPLHMACKFGHDKVVEVLIGHPKTDRKMKNKYGEIPKDIICSRCPNASAGIKERIEMLLEGQSYVPLLRSEDNSTVPVVGQPWSPDKNSSLQREEKTWSPKDPSMSVKAYAGPMSPSNARAFHKRWTTPPSQSPDQAKKYINIKRSDSDKGLERIGRQLAHEMQIPWLEYWEFLDTYIDLSCENGLDRLEKYLQKTVWLEYVKTFKDKHGLNEDLLEFSTPVKRSKPVSHNDPDEVLSSETNNNVITAVQPSSPCDSQVVSPMTSLAQSLAQMKLQDNSWSEDATIASTDDSVNDTESDFTTSSEIDKNKIEENNDIDTTERESKENPPSLDAGESDTKTVIDSNNKDDNSLNDNGRLNDKDGDKVGDVDGEHTESPSQNAGEKAGESNKNPIIESNTEDDDGTLNDNDGNKVSEVDGKHTESPSQNAGEKAGESDQKPIIESNTKDDNGTLNDNDGNKVSDASNKDFLEKVEDTKTEETNKLSQSEIKDVQVGDQNDTSVVKRKDLLKQRSLSTESTDSFKTTTDDIEDTDAAKFHDVEDTDKHVCINVCDSSVIDQLKLHLEKRTNNTSESPDTTVHFVVRLKSVGSNSGLKVDLLSLPTGVDVVRCCELLMLEGVGVSSLEGDIGATKDGEMVEVGCVSYTSDVPIYAYLSRAVTLPKVAYLHGPQPTREDLDVSRALGDTVLVPDLYPNVFQWKIRLSRFLRDTNYRWQSPAKVRSKLRQGSPQASPLRRTSPVIQYGSPLGLNNQQRATGSSDIRTRLFPSIAE